MPVPSPLEENLNDLPVFGATVINLRKDTLLIFFRSFFLHFLLCAHTLRYDTKKRTQGKKKKRCGSCGAHKLFVTAGDHFSMLGKTTVGALK